MKIDLLKKDANAEQIFHMSFARYDLELMHTMYFRKKFNADIQGYLFTEKSLDNWNDMFLLDVVCPKQGLTIN